MGDRPDLRCECCERGDVGLGVYGTENDDAVLLCDQCVLALSVKADSQ